jgi:hypothetical protein
MTDNAYVAYSDVVEKQTPDEDELITKIVESMGRSNKQAYNKYKHGVRDAHAKSHGVLRGELTVEPDLGSHLRQGMFKTAATYPVIARISSAFGEIRSDQIHFARGMAIKVLGVHGAKALPGDDGVTQDFLLVNAPTIAFGDVRAYHKAMPFAAMQAKAPDVALRVTGELARAVAGVLNAVHVAPPTPIELLAGPNDHILGETFHSMAALRFGDYIAKLSVAPLSESVRALTGRPLEGTLGADALRDLVVNFFASNSAEYELRAQLCTDLQTMPVEDASVLWPSSLSPHQRVAKITFPAQDAYSAARRAYADDVLSFNPWHALADHRPLGSINRIRIKAYEASTAFRHEMNDAPRIEPREIAELPD